MEKHKFKFFRHIIKNTKQIARNNKKEKIDTFFLIVSKGYFFYDYFFNFIHYLYLRLEWNF